MASTQTPYEIMSALIEGRKPQRRSASVSIGVYHSQQEPRGLPAIFSYGQHFPMAVHEGCAWWVNTERYSQTTTMHQKGVREALSEHGYRPTGDTMTIQGMTFERWH